MVVLLPPTMIPYNPEALSLIVTAARMAKKTAGDTVNRVAGVLPAAGIFSK